MTITVVNERQRLFFEGLTRLCDTFGVTITRESDNRAWYPEYEIHYRFNYDSDWNELADTPDVVDNYITPNEKVV